MADPRLVVDFDAIAEAIADRVVERLGGGAQIDQHSSPLGSRRHHDVVRRRLAEGLPGAAIVGRRHLLSRKALSEELARVGRAGAETSAPTRCDARDDAALLTRLGLRRVK